MSAKLDSYVSSYFRWAIGGQGGADLDTLLSKPLSKRERNALLTRVEEIHKLLAFLEYVQSAARLKSVGLPPGIRGRG